MLTERDVLSCYRGIHQPLQTWAQYGALGLVWGDSWTVWVWIDHNTRGQATTRMWTSHDVVKVRQGSM
jgi:hypothetical protein